MKKIFTTLAVFLSLALVACGGKTSEPEGESSVTPEQENCQHKYGKEKFNEVAATCTTEGSYQTKCEKCGYMKTTTVKALGHDFSVVMSDTATCTTAGVAVYKCSRCTETEEKTSEAHHNFQPIEYTKGEGQVTATVSKCSLCNIYSVKWDAQDAAKQSSNFNSEGKLTGNGSGYVAYKFYSPVAMTARLWVNCTFRTNEWWDRANPNNSSQAVWYNYKEETDAPNFKYDVLFNNEEVVQENQTYELNGETLAIGDLMFPDFVESGTGSGVLPWLELNLNQGENSLKITRKCGYTNYFVGFEFLGFAA